MNPVNTLKAFAQRLGGQTAAARKLGCSPQFVSAMVCGKKPIPDAVLKKLGLRRQTIISQG